MKTKTQHTPGPWTVRGSHKGGWKVVGPDYREGASMFAVAHTDYAYIEPVEEANARLIAAAPDLLEALTAILANETPADSVWKRASAAVAKAGGPCKNIADSDEIEIARKGQSVLNLLDGLTIEGKSGQYQAFDLAREEFRAAIAKAEGK